jgi:hypothetical protein
MGKNNYNVVITDNILMLQFINLETMTQYIEPVSLFVEGKTNIIRVGHNFSVNDFQRYIKFNRNVSKETNELMKHIKISPNVKYIISFIKGDVHTKNHELQHAKYYCDEKYRQYVNGLWDNMDAKKRAYIVQFLEKLGYSNEVIVDEFQAYYMTEKRNFFGISI